MDFDIEIRKKQLDHLDQVISSSKLRLESVLGCLGWTSEKVKEERKPAATCPINPNHTVTSKSWNGHIEKCMIKAEGYDLKEQFLSESLSDPAQSIYLDRNKKIEVITKEITEKGQIRLESHYNFDELKMKLEIYHIHRPWNGLDPDPRTSDRYISTYSPDERLAFYNYTVQNTTGPQEPPEFLTIVDKKQENKELTYEELLALERDAKRRRAKYKSVHINRKNHIEVMREVIDGQMEEYKDWLLAKDGKANNYLDCHNGIKLELETNKETLEIENERPSSSISRNSTHSSRSRSTSGRRDYRRRSRERDRSRRSHDRRRRSRSHSHYRKDYHDKGRYVHSSEQGRRSREKRNTRDDDPVRRH